MQGRIAVSDEIAQTTFFAALTGRKTGEVRVEVIRTVYQWCQGTFSKKRI